MDISEFRSLPELMRAILGTPGADEWFATDLVVAWMRAHPDVVRALLVEDPASLLGELP